MTPKEKEAAMRKAYREAPPKLYWEDERQGGCPLGTYAFYQRLTGGTYAPDIMGEGDYETVTHSGWYWSPYSEDEADDMLGDAIGFGPFNTRSEAVEDAWRFYS